MCRHPSRRCMRRLVAAAVGGMVLMLSQIANPLAVRAEPAAKKELPARPAQQLIRETIDVVFKILKDPELKKDAKLRMVKLREAVDRAFAWDVMAQSSLGPPWRKLDDKQRAEFIAIFKELLAQEYMDDIDRFQGNEAVQIKNSEKSGDLEIVKTILITSSREQIPMDYTLQEVNKRSAVVDLSVEGVSLVNHYRQTFSRYLANKSFPELMQQLKRKSGIRE